MARKTYTKKNNYGCYIINTGSFNEEEKPIYKVGKSTNIIERFKAHRTGSPLATLVKTFPVATDQVDPKNQVNRSAKLNEQEHHIHYSLSSYAFNTEGPGGIEFFCFNNDEEAVDKINEVLGYEKMADKPILLPKERKKQRKKRRHRHSYQDINLTIKTRTVIFSMRELNLKDMPLPINIKGWLRWLGYRVFRMFSWLRFSIFNSTLTRINLRRVRAILTSVFIVL